MAEKVDLQNKTEIFLTRNSASILIDKLCKTNGLKTIEKKIVSKVVTETFGLGYKIMAPKEVPLPEPISQEAQEILEMLLDTSTVDLNVLLSRWNTRNPEKWPNLPQFYVTFSEKLLKSGVPLAACDVLTNGLLRCPQDVRLRQLMALSLLRAGGTKRAQTLLSQLYKEGNADEETIGLLARTYKDLGMQSPDPELREKKFEMAFHFYAKAFQLSGGYWTGINAATMAFLLSRKDKALKLANNVKAKCEEDLMRVQREQQDPYWPLATMGEVSLILGEYQEAVKFYGQAAKIGRGRYGDLSTTRRNARLLLRRMNISGEEIERCFEIPPVLVFAGWIRNGKAIMPPVLSKKLENQLRNAFRERLSVLKFSMAYASASTTPDILFLENIHQMNAETNIIISKKRGNNIFSQDIRGFSQVRLKKVLDGASQVVSISDQNIQEETVANEYAEMYLLGMANLRAKQLETDLVPVVVIDEIGLIKAEQNNDIFLRMKKLCNKIEVIHLDGKKQSSSALKSGDEPVSKVVRHGKKEPDFPKKEFSTVIRALLFGDAVHFSRLAEEQIPIFHREFLKPIGDLVANSANAPLIKNTWGDGLYFVFKSVKDAGLFALDLCEWVNSVDWEKKGLPVTMNLRTALHAGPVFFCHDPITGEKTFSGTHVSRAARIEPITPTGQVYSSQAFAALATAERTEGFTCEFVGQTPLAKGYGTFPTYLVRRDLIKF